MLVEAAVGGMDRSRDDARFHALALLAEIDQKHAFGVVHDDAFRRYRRHFALAVEIQPHPDIFRNRHIHHFRVRQVQAGHQLDIFSARSDLQARIVGPFLADGRDHVTLVVMGRIDKRAFGQFQHPVEQRIILLTGITVLEIRPAGAADQKRVAGEYPVVHAETVAVIGVPRRVHGRQVDPLDGYPLAVGDPHRHHIDRRLLAHHRDAVRAVAKGTHGGNMVGMDMGVDNLHQLQVQLLQQPDIAVGFLEHRVDQQRLAAGAACQQVGVGRGNRIEHLPKNHRNILPSLRNLQNLAW